ncbi:MAG: ATP-binding protein [Eubacteriales bacterium]|nr:ATP-binding protein [Eubacteriales bacterium]
MQLTDFQLRKLQTLFDERRIDNHHQWQERLQRAYRQYPPLADFDQKLVKLRTALGRAKILHSPSAIEDLTEEIAMTKLERSHFLQRNGIAEADLHLQSHCPYCQDQGFVDGQPCHCYLREMIRLFYQDAGLTALDQKASFSNFDLRFYEDAATQTGYTSPRRLANTALQTAVRFVEHHPTGDNLFFTGKPGLGKTFLSHCIANALIDKGVPVLYLSSANLFRLIEADTFDRNTHPMTEYLQKVDVLIIDDLGTEMINSFVVSALFELINARLGKNLSTVISTNLGLEEILQQYSERVLSRIAGHYLILQLTGRDIRIQKRTRIAQTEA